MQCSGSHLMRKGYRVDTSKNGYGEKDVEWLYQDEEKGIQSGYIKNVKEKKMQSGYIKMRRKGYRSDTSRKMRRKIYRIDTTSR